MIGVMDRITHFLLKNGCPYYEDAYTETYVLNIEKSFLFVDLAEEDLISIIGGDVYCKCGSRFFINDFFYLAWSCESRMESERGTRRFFEYCLELARKNLERIKKVSEQQNVALFIGFVYEYNIPQKTCNCIE